MFQAEHAVEITQNISGICLKTFPIRKDRPQISGKNADRSDQLSRRIVVLIKFSVPAYGSPGRSHSIEQYPW